MTFGVVGLAYCYFMLAHCAPSRAAHCKVCIGLAGMAFLSGSQKTPHMVDSISHHSIEAYTISCCLEEQEDMYLSLYIYV